MFSCEFWEMSNNTFVHKHLLWLLLSNESGGSSRPSERRAQGPMKQLFEPIRSQCTLSLPRGGGGVEQLGSKEKVYWEPKS